MSRKNVIILLAVVLSIVLLCGLSFGMANKETLNDKNIQYYVVLFGFGEEDVREIYNENPAGFARQVKYMLEGRLYTDNMYNLENNLDVSDVTLNKSVSECASLFSISENTVRKHVKICGANVYNKLIEAYMSYDSYQLTDEAVSTEETIN